MLLAHRVGKHTKKRKKRLDRARAKLREKEKKKKKPDMFDTAALHLLHDPQGFAERLMTQVEKTTERFEVYALKERKGNSIYVAIRLRYFSLRKCLWIIWMSMFKFDLFTMPGEIVEERKLGNLRERQSSTFPDFGISCYLYAVFSQLVRDDVII